MLQRQFVKQNTRMGIKAFTLIEVLMVMTIFSIGILAVAAMQMTSTKGNASARRMTEALALAENHVENLMRLPYDHADLDPANNPHTSSQGPYSISWNVTELDLDANGTNDSKTVNVTVGWRYGRKRNVSIHYILPEY